METLAEGVWRSLSAVSPGARLIAHGGGNGQLFRWYPTALLRVVWLLARREVDVVLTGDALTYAVLRPILLLSRVRNATMVMGLDVTFDNRLYRAVVHPALRKAPSVIAISQATADAATGFGVPHDHISVVRLGVQSEWVSAAERDAARHVLRRRLDVGDDTVLLLTLGRLVRRKGARWFVRHVLPGLPDNVHYVLAGSGPEERAIVAAAQASGMAARLHMLGRVDDVLREELMCGADVFVQPNIPVAGDMEGFGLVTVEAAIRGTPVVAADLEGIKDAVVDRETGVLLPPQDAPAWTATLERLIADRPGLVEMGAAFQAAASARYSELAMGRALCAVLGVTVEPQPAG